MFVSLKRLFFPKIRQFLRDHSENSRVSFSQCGEDLIIKHLFMILGISDVKYLDVGAHHPTYLSNTYLFYQNGSSGVTVEPDPSLFQKIREKRSRDINLNVGVGVSNGEADFFVMSTTTLNTFSKEEAMRYESYGTHRIEKVIKLKLETINNIIRDNFLETPNLVSIDVEGLDYLVLKSFDFSKYRPQVFCIETITYSEDNSGRKVSEIIDLMHSHGYNTYADTHINTIFVDAEIWPIQK